jgi:hypothetical protein
MANIIPSKIEQRIKDALKRFQPLVESAKARDIGEADTSTLIKDIFAELLGYDKYAEITAEFMIKSTYCDLAVKLDGKIALLIEVKAVGVELKEAHVKQAIDYGANQGVEWVLLTNGQTWNLYKITFGQPIGQELLFTFQFSALSAKNAEDLQALYLLSKEGQGKSLLNEYHQQKQVLSRFILGAIALGEPVLTAIRRELKKLSPDAKIDLNEIKNVLAAEVFKRDVLEGDGADEAKKKLARAAKKLEREKAKSAPAAPTPAQPAAPVIAAVPTPEQPALEPTPEPPLTAV